MKLYSAAIHDQQESKGSVGWHLYVKLGLNLVVFMCLLVNPPCFVVDLYWSRYIKNGVFLMDTVLKMI